MEINELLQQITDTCKQQLTSGNWSKNEAMRYAYITLGKELSKSARFFFSIEGKYGEHGLSVEEMKQIHYAEKGYEVTCYVSAKMLKDIFSKLGIRSSIIQSEFARPYYSEDGVLDIYHSYLLCYGDEGKKYFLSLNSDLVNIKLNAPTEHFGVTIPYIYNGKQTYQGEEIQHEELSSEELLRIDTKIGYAFPVHNMETENDSIVYANVNDPKHDLFGKQKLPFDYLVSQLPELDQNFLIGFDELCQSFKYDNGKPKNNFSELSVAELREVEWYIFSRCADLVRKNQNLDSINLDRFIGIFNNPTLDTKKLQKEASLFLKDLESKSNSSSSHIQTNPFRILSQSIKLITAIENLVEQQKSGNALSEKERATLRQLFIENKTKVSMLFLPQDVIDMYCGDKNPSNEFLVEKIINCLEEDFECSHSKTSSYRPVISRNMKTVEQAKFLKDYLRTILKLELPTETAFQSRIMFSTLSEIGNPDKNAFMIYVKSNENNPNSHSYSMIYNPESNSINPASILAIRRKYKILSKLVNAQINGSNKTVSRLEPNE